MCISTCLVLYLVTGSVDISITLWFSQKRTVDKVLPRSNFGRIPCNQIAWVQAFTAPQYSTSTEDNAMVACFGRPENGATTKNEQISISLLYINRITHPIGICVSNQLYLGVCSIVNDVGPGSLNTVEDHLGCLPMKIMRLLHVSWYNIHGIIYIRPRMCQVQLATNQLPIDSAVHGRCAFSFFNASLWKEREWSNLTFSHVKLN